MRCGGRGAVLIIILLVSPLTGVVAGEGRQAPQTPTAPSTPGQPTPGQTMTPPRDSTQPAAPDKGTAVIRGVVLSADDGSPVRRAEVRAFLQGGRNFFGHADAEGRFELPELPAGTYVLSASKSGYLSPGEPSATVPRDVRVEIADRQVVEKVQLLLSKGAVITGRIVDDLGDPAINVTVQALRFAYRDGVRQLSPVSGHYGLRTDDLGQFRLFGLVPGDYYIAAKPANVGGLRPQPLQQGAATTFYPGTQDVAEARRVRAIAGRETGPIAIALGTTRLARVRGHAFSASGTPMKGTVSIAHRDPFDSSGSSTGGSIRPDGSFEFNSVSPGAYVLTARDSHDFNTTPFEQGSIRVTVAGRDVEGLTIFAAREAVLRGRVVTDDGSPLPQGLQRTRIEVLAADPADAYSGWNQASAALKEDGTFEVKGMFGRRRIVLNRVLDWQTRETRANGEDVTDIGIEFESGQVIEDAEIILTRKVTALSGTVTDRAGTPVPRATIVLFSEDERRWLPRSRFVRMGMTGDKGAYGITGAPPSDDYLAVAVTGIEDGQWTDPEFLRAVKEVGTRVRLKAGETKTLDLKVAEKR